MVVLGDLLQSMLSPLQQEPPIINERCPDCHVPLHDGRELHYVWRHDTVRKRRIVIRQFRPHTCTATGPVMVDLINRAPPLPREPGQR